MSLTQCLKRAGDALRTEDKADILAAAAKYRKQGMSADEAGRKAVDDQIAKVQAMLEAPAVEAPATVAPGAAETWMAMSGTERAKLLDTYFGAGQTDAGARYAGRTWQSFTVGEQATLAAAMNIGQPTPENDRDHFTLERGTPDNTLEKVTFSRGEYITYRVGEGGKEAFGEIDGISQARREFSVDGLWYPFGFAYKAVKPEPVPQQGTVPMSKVIDRINKKFGEGLTDADKVPEPQSPTEADAALWKKVTAGEATPDEFKAGFEAWVSNKDEILAELSAKTKAELMKMGGDWFASRYKNDSKPEIVDAMWRQGASAYTLGRSFQYGMGKDSYVNGIRKMVEATDAEQLAQYVADRKAAQEEALARVKKITEAIKDPKTLSDFNTWMRATMEGGKTFHEARMMLTPAQRAAYDELAAESSRSNRKEKQDAERTTVRAAGQTTAGEIIATKHTRDGHDLWVVKLADRVSKDDYVTLLAGAKRLGGNYSSYRGNGAVPGFQFRTPDAAQAFLKLAGGDAAAATEAAKERRDAFEDDRSQTAAERLNEMADRLQERADESLGRDRKANTERRARFAASAEAAANADKAMATTMRRLASAITEGKAKFLDRVRQKVQVELLDGYVRTAKDAELRAKHQSYADQERHKGEPATGETADFAEFPSYTAYRSDLASLGRQLLEVDGTKKLGQQIMAVADDVSDAFTAFAKEPGNLFTLSTFSVRAGDEVRTAIFPTREGAERAIQRSGLSGKAIVFPEKRGVNRIIMSPSEAMARGVWKGDGDKRITLKAEFGAELVEKIGRANRRGAKVSVPWQFERAYDRRKVLSRMGIESPAEFRAALREFIGLREQAAAPDKVKQMERAMIGRRNDGLDFFPTPESVADEMVAAADIQPGMRVLEPSAGMGHIAERIRATEVDPDVVEFSNDRRELLEAKGFNVVGQDFMAVEEGGYDRIIMNPPFSDGRDIQHVRHAYDLLKPGGRLVAIMGESAFTNQNKRATEFREWLDERGGTEEKLPEGTFNDPSLPVNTGANARMVVIDKPASSETSFSRSGSRYGTPIADAEAAVALIRQALPKAPPIIVLDDVRKAPAALLRDIRDAGAEGDVEAAYHAGNVYVFPEHIESVERLMFVVGRHEIRHYGLDAMLGRRKGQVLLGIGMKNPALMEAAREKVRDGLADNITKGIEEALADMPVERLEALSGWDRLVSAIRQWLRDTAARLRSQGLESVANMLDPAGWTDKDVAHFVLRVEAISRNGDQGQAVGGTMFSEAQEDGAMFSRAPTMTATRATVPDWIAAGNPALQAAAGKISTYAPAKPITEKVREMATGWKQKLVQGLFDAYAPLKDLSMDAYIAARMTKAADGAFEGMLMYGKPLMQADGGITGDLDGKGFLGMMRELKGEHDRFFMWVAGNRAARLMADGKENLFKPDEIAAMQALNSGTMQDGSSRTAAFKRALDQFNAYSKAVLDVAEKSGLIDGDSRKVWEHDFYVPFYRVNDEAEISGPGKIKGLVRQKAFERLKGGKEPLGDLMDNTLRNWSHLLSASLSNVAASKSLLAAEGAGIAIEAKEADAKEIAKATGKKGHAVYFMDQGAQRWFVVEDESVLAAVSALEAPALSGMPLQLMSKFKKYLTIGVTIAPAFKVRNLIRDTLAAPAANQMDYNIAKNLAQGWKGTDTKTDAYAQMLFSGGLMKFGTYLEGDRAENVKRLIAQGVDRKTILDSPNKVRAALGLLWDSWQDFGDRMENVNRTALYQQLLDKGVSPREAAFQARDMMDFSLQGAWAGMRTLNAVVPFLNARAQGLYKLGRAAKEDPKRMGYMVGAVSLASIALLLAYQDDDDWKAREDWDRDGFWWIKIGETAYRIPKPFELGAMGTIAERSVELLIDDEMTGARFAERMKQMVTGTFAINPVPQMFKPMLDLYANKDSFTGRQIETLGMERLSKPERYGPNTSAMARALGAAGDYTGISPVQVDHMVRAYFGWLGVQAATAVDVITSPMDSTIKPASKLEDWSGGFVKDLPAAPSRYLEQFYEQAKKTSEAMADLKRARESGDLEKAAEIMEDRASDIAKYRLYQRAERQIGELNKRIRVIRYSTKIDSDDKRTRLDELVAQRNNLAKMVSARAQSQQ